MYTRIREYSIHEIDTPSRDFVKESKNKVLQSAKPDRVPWRHWTRNTEIGAAFRSLWALRPIPRFDGLTWPVEEIRTKDNWK